MQTYRKIKSNLHKLHMESLTFYLEFEKLIYFFGKYCQ